MKHKQPPHIYNPNNTNPPLISPTAHQLFDKMSQTKLTPIENKIKKLPFLSHSMSLDPPKLTSPWGFPSCGHLETLSFRSTATVDGEPENTGDPVELGLRSDRLFFEPERSSLLVEECVKEEEDDQEMIKTEEYKESEMVFMDSSNPKEDFKKSMEEMVNAYGLMKDWDGLEELLGCFLRINCKNNHIYILSAFVDLLVSLPFTPSSTTTTTSNSIAFSSPSSPFSLPSSSLSSILDHHGDDDHDDHPHNDNDDDHHISS